MCLMLVASAIIFMLASGASLIISQIFENGGRVKVDFYKDIKHF